MPTIAANVPIRHVVAGSARRSVSGALALACAAVLLGCEAAPMETESVFQAIAPAPPSPADAAAWMFDPYDADKRFRGTVLLANAPFGGESVYLQGYRAHLADSDASVRAAAAFALGRHGSPEDVPLVAPLTRDTDRLVRLNAVRALQRLHNPEAIPWLLERVQFVEVTRQGQRGFEDDPDVRAEAAYALGQYAEARVLDGLIAALRDPRLTVTRSAAEALHTLTGRDFGDDRRAWFQWKETAEDPFAGRLVYKYPVFSRDRALVEWLPFWTPPPNEEPGTPAGMPAIGAQPSGDEGAAG